MRALLAFFAALHVGDSKLFLLINRRFRCDLLDTMMSRLTHLGGAFFSIFICLTLIFLNFRTSRQPAIEALAALTLSQILVQFLKRKIGRLRPYLAMEDIVVQKPLFDNSFPSGHTTAGYALASIFSLNYPFLTFPLLGMATIIGFSRTYLGFHYPLDVAVGAVLGGGTAFTVHHFVFI
ncbi:MAG: phosphatase PAP2 family protein [Clostridia bacterium]|nr:phosphatase PAP2 family protein [Clostridia bacterium]